MSNQKTDLRFLDLARGTSGRWPTFAKSVLGPRGEGDPAVGDPPAVDLGNAAVQAAIAAATQRAVAAAAQGWETEKASIIGNRDQILAEKKRFEAFGKPDELAERLKRLEALEAKTKATELGGDPERWTAEVDRAAQAKYEAKAGELSAVMKQKDDRIAELETENKKIVEAEHRQFVAREIAQATMPPELKVIQDGAHQILVDRLVEVMVRQKIDGIGEVGRFKLNGALVPGKGPDGLMTTAELVDLARQGKGPIPNLGFCFVSAGQGSGTQTPQSSQASSAAGGNWWKMTPDARSEYVKINGREAAQDLMDRSPREKAA